MAMKEHIVLLNYPESQWGSDLVRFKVLDCYSETQVLDELRYKRAELHSADFDSLQDMADALCNAVAYALSGTWEYVVQCGSFDISEADDEDYDDEEEEDDEEVF